MQNTLPPLQGHAHTVFHCLIDTNHTVFPIISVFPPSFNAITAQTQQEMKSPSGNFAKP